MQGSGSGPTGGVVTTPVDKHTDLTGSQPGIPNEYSDTPVQQGKLQEVIEEKERRNSLAPFDFENKHHVGPLIEVNIGNTFTYMLSRTVAYHGMSLVLATSLGRLTPRLFLASMDCVESSTESLRRVHASYEWTARLGFCLVGDRSDLGDHPFNANSPCGRSVLS